MPLSVSLVEEAKVPRKKPPTCRKLHIIIKKRKYNNSTKIIKMIKQHSPQTIERTKKTRKFGINE